MRKVAILAQFYDTPSKFEQLLEDMRALQEDASRALHFVVIGPSSPYKIKRVLHEFSSSTIITHHPIMKAIMGYQILPDLSDVKANESVGHAALAVNNVAQFQRYCSRLRALKRTSSSKDSLETQLKLLQIS